MFIPTRSGDWKDVPRVNVVVPQNYLHRKPIAFSESLTRVVIIFTCPNCFRLVQYFKGLKSNKGCKSNEKYKIILILTDHFGVPLNINALLDTLPTSFGIWNNLRIQLWCPCNTWNIRNIFFKQNNQIRLLINKSNCACRGETD